MNQDGYLAEWLKSRNLLTELHPSCKGSFQLFCDDDEVYELTSDMTAAQVWGDCNVCGLH